MITIEHKINCCGCFACMETCPRSCITLQADQEGFYYPTVNMKKCIDCNLCVKVCPVIHRKQIKRPNRIFAAINPDEETRMHSSSGGVFSLFAETIVKEGGIVFGAAFDEDWNVKHIAISDSANLAKLRGSKYVQSSLNGQLSQVEKYLKKGKKVLFSGTPCQIVGLKNFLQQDYPNLYTVDFICHGVPSPMIWQFYLNEVLSRFKIDRNSIKRINFRDKSFGWKKFSFSLTYQKQGKERTLTELFYRNHYVRGFLYNIYLRPSCYACPAKSGRSNSDITIADFWGVKYVCPDLCDDKGTSLVMVNSENGLKLYKNINIPSRETNYESIFPYNKSIELSADLPEEKRKIFFEGFRHKKFSHLVIRLTDLSLKERLKERIQYIINTFFTKK